jgi:hypothetical protein
MGPALAKLAVKRAGSEKRVIGGLVFLKLVYRMS